ncbi:MAG: hypothetical protein GY906_02755 [bacterium]|nr:hypothetical protein [bacterium]
MGDLISKVQGYMILSGDGVEELGKLMNEKLVEWWSPLKGPSVFKDSICQAMAGALRFNPISLRLTFSPWPFCRIAVRPA